MGMTRGGFRTAHCSHTHNTRVVRPPSPPTVPCIATVLFLVRDTRSPVFFFFPQRPTEPPVELSGQKQAGDFDVRAGCSISWFPRPPGHATLAKEVALHDGAIWFTFQVRGWTE
jgi:hypothetical protein